EAFIRQNLSRRIGVGEVADATGLTGRHLLRLFRSAHNTTVLDFMRQARVREASRLLLETDQSIKSIASRVGYTDLQEFNKLMRSATGASPTAFRTSAGKA